MCGSLEFSKREKNFFTERLIFQALKKFFAKKRFSEKKSLGTS
jgi:hypothetical protein